MVYAILLRDKCNIPTIRIKGFTWDNENVSVAAASFFSGVRIRLGMIFNYLISWVRVKGQG